MAKKIFSSAYFVLYLIHFNLHPSNVFSHYYTIASCFLCLVIPFAILGHFLFDVVLNKNLVSLNLNTFCLAFTAIIWCFSFWHVFMPVLYSIVFIFFLIHQILNKSIYEK